MPLQGTSRSSRSSFALLFLSPTCIAPPFSYTFSLFNVLLPVFVLLLHPILHVFLASSPPSSLNPLSPCVIYSPLVLSSMSISDFSSPPHLYCVPLDVIPSHHISSSFVISYPPASFSHSDAPVTPCATFSCSPASSPSPQIKIFAPVGSLHMDFNAIAGNGPNGLDHVSWSRASTTQRHHDPRDQPSDEPINVETWVDTSEAPSVVIILIHS